MLVLDKARALDRMVYLSDRKANAVPEEFLRPSPLRWIAHPIGRRALAGKVVLRPTASPLSGLERSSSAAAFKEPPVVETVS